MRDNEQGRWAGQLGQYSVYYRILSGKSLVVLQSVWPSIRSVRVAETISCTQMFGFVKTKFSFNSIKAPSHKCRISLRMNNECHFWHPLISVSCPFDPLNGPLMCVVCACYFSPLSTSFFLSLKAWSHECRIGQHVRNECRLTLTKEKNNTLKQRTLIPNDERLFRGSNVMNVHETDINGCQKMAFVANTAFVRPGLIRHLYLMRWRCYSCVSFPRA